MQNTASRISFQRDQGVGRLVISHPPLNILTMAVLEELKDTLEAIDPKGLKVVVVESDQKAFSAGADVEEHLPGKVADMLRTFHRAMETLVAFPAPTVAAVKGAALGGGLELALCCDFIVASRSARLGQPEIAVGVFPPVAVVLLPMIMPERRAWEMIMTGRPIDPDEALSLGLVNRLVEDDKFDEELERFVKGLARQSSSVLQMTRKALRMGSDWRERLLEVERLYLAELMELPDAVEGLEAFMEKRKPNWS